MVRGSDDEVVWELSEEEVVLCLVDREMRGLQG